MLHLPSTDQSMWKECNQSLIEEPINLHILDGVKGHVGKARHNGFTLGSAPYVSCVDPDDIVLPGAFEACIKVLEKNPHACGAYTDEIIIDKNGEEINPGFWSGIPWNPLLQLEPRYLHHVYVMRREFVEKCYLELIRWPNMSEYILKCFLTKYGPWIHVNRFGYKWRLLKESCHNQMSQTSVCAAQWRVIPILQKAAKKYKAVIRTDF